MTWLLSLRSTGRRVWLTSVALTLLACDNPNDDSSFPTSSSELSANSIRARDIRPAIKRVIAEALAGSYNKACHDYSGISSLAAAEQSIVLTKDGVVNSGIGDFDLVRTRKAEVMLTIDSMLASFAADISIRDEKNEKLLYTLAIQHSATQTNATLHSAVRQPSRVIACDGTTPDALALDVWTPVVNQMAEVAITLPCRNTKARASTIRLQIARGEIRINDAIFTADNASQQQSIHSNNAGVVFSFNSKEGTRYDLHITTDAQLTALHISKNAERTICQ